MNDMINKLNTLSVEQVAEIAARMAGMTGNEADTILDAALAVLEEKMETSDFVRFCHKLA